MSEATQPHAEPQNGELKPHGDELAGALNPTSDSQANTERQNTAHRGTETEE